MSRIVEGEEIQTCMTQESLPLTRESQTDAIRDYLLAGNTLTQLQSLDRFRCLRLGARCWDLRQRGINVQSRLVETPSGKHIAEYFIPQNEQFIPRNGKKKTKSITIEKLRELAIEEAKSLEEQLLFSRLIARVE